MIDFVNPSVSAEPREKLFGLPREMDDALAKTLDDTWSSRVLEHLQSESEEVWQEVATAIDQQRPTFDPSGANAIFVQCLNSMSPENIARTKWALVIMTHTSNFCDFTDCPISFYDCFHPLIVAPVEVGMMYTIMETLSDFLGTRTQKLPWALALSMDILSVLRLEGDYKMIRCTCWDVFVKLVPLCIIEGDQIPEIFGMLLHHVNFEDQIEVASWIDAAKYMLDTWKGLYDMFDDGTITGFVNLLNGNNPAIVGKVAKLFIPLIPRTVDFLVENNVIAMLLNTHSHNIIHNHVDRILKFIEKLTEASPAACMQVLECQFFAIGTWYQETTPKAKIIVSWILNNVCNITDPPSDEISVRYITNSLPGNFDYGDEEVTIMTIRLMMKLAMKQYDFGIPDEIREFEQDDEVPELSVLARQYIHLIEVGTIQE